MYSLKLVNMFLIIMADGDEDDKAADDDDDDGDVPPVPNGERRHQLRHSRR